MFCCVNFSEIYWTSSETFWTNRSNTRYGWARSPMLSNFSGQFPFGSDHCCVNYALAEEKRSLSWHSPPISSSCTDPYCSLQLQRLPFFSTSKFLGMTKAVLATQKQTQKQIQHWWICSKKHVTRLPMAIELRAHWNKPSAQVDRPLPTLQRWLERPVLTIKKCKYGYYLRTYEATNGAFFVVNNRFVWWIAYCARVMRRAT